MKKIKNILLLGVFALVTILGNSAFANGQERGNTSTTSVKNILVGSRVAEETVQAKQLEELTQEQEERQADRRELQTKGPLAKSVFLRDGYTTHQIFSISFDNKAVELEDGSIYTLGAAGASAVKTWAPGDLVVLRDNMTLFSSYSFTLENLVVLNSANVNLSLGPIYSGAYTLYVVAINDLLGDVYLNDGSIWHLKGWTTSLSWAVNDTVIIGANSGVFGVPTYPHIMINVNLNKYIPVQLVY